MKITKEYLEQLIRETFEDASHSTQNASIVDNLTEEDKEEKGDERPRRHKRRSKRRNERERE